jgi:cytidylate kinase
MNLARDQLTRPVLKLRNLLVRLARTDLEFVVIGSSALAIHGWEVSPSDLDLLMKLEDVDQLLAALDLESSQGRWVTDGAARRFEFMTPDGAVDVYVEVSGSLSFDKVYAEAPLVSLGEGDLRVRAGTPEHVRDMRAAGGRNTLPDKAIAPAAREGVPRIIAIDGPAGAGKSTVTRAVAREIGFTYLDTGAMYRCVALAVFEQKADTDNPKRIGKIAEDIDIGFEGDQVLLDGRDVTAAIRTPVVTEATSHIAAYPEVREAMQRQQQQLFSEGPYVAEGRDITTVVAPDAPLKIYLTASLEERARRRAAEGGESYEGVMASLRERDYLDSARELSALKIAEDAVVLDTTGHSVDEVVDQIAALARQRGLV